MNDPTNPKHKTIKWQHGMTSVETLGGMLGPTHFILADGTEITPFQISPWFDEPQAKNLDGILQRLRGEWPCVPFGLDSLREAKGEWPSSFPVKGLDHPHGYGSNNHWTINNSNAGSIQLHVDYPEGHSIKRLERTITPDPNAAAIDFELNIIPKNNCSLPIGLHPVFKLPIDPSGFSIEVEGSSRVATFPGDLDRSSIFTPDKLASISEVPLRNGGHCDARMLPMGLNTEDLLQLIDVEGSVSLINHSQGYKINLSWQKEHFPSLLFWISNKGRTEYPWLGRHLALGVEPICSAFDLGSQISTSTNPLNKLGVPTAHDFKAGEVFTTKYRVEISLCD